MPKKSFSKEASRVLGLGGYRKSSSATLTITGAASAGPLDCESLDCTFGQRGLRRRDELGHGLRAAALRLQHAHRDQHFRLLGRSLPDEELGGLEQAASVQQQRGPRQRPGAAAAGQPERAGRRRGALSRASVVGAHNVPGFAARVRV